VLGLVVDQVLKTPVRSPQANAHCERLIGTIRRECLDFVISLNERHLRSVLTAWVAHYNRGRPHASLGPGIPHLPLDLSEVGAHGHRIPVGHEVLGTAVLGGLHHEYNQLHDRRLVPGRNHVSQVGHAEFLRSTGLAMIPNPSSSAMISTIQFAITSARQGSGRAEPCPGSASLSRGRSCHLNDEYSRAKVQNVWADNSERNHGPFGWRRRVLPQWSSA
jgi:hypothetical protein